MTTLECPAVGPDAKREALDLALKSASFSRSDQLKRFLRYVCEKEIAGKSDEINEYLIGIEALGKPPGYSPGNDSSVRTRAHALRQKLQELYELEQPDAKMRIEIPKGCYTPHFYAPDLTIPVQKPVPQAALQKVFIPQPEGWNTKHLLWMFAAGALTALLAAGVLLGLTKPWKAAASIDPIVRAAWGPMLGPEQQVDICIATPPALLLHPYRGALPVFRHFMPVPGEVSSWYQSLHMTNGGGVLYMQTTQNTMLFGDGLAAVAVSRLLSLAGTDAHVVPEDSLRPFALRDRNVILIGSPIYSPFAARVLEHAPFSVHDDSATREEVISEGIPGPGAKQVFHPNRDQFGLLTTAYGLITVVPSQEGRKKTIVFSGITSAGPQAAMEFFQSAPGLQELKKQLAKQGYGRFPPAYQVVVRCGMDHSLALNWVYQTHKVITAVPPFN